MILQEPVIAYYRSKESLKLLRFLLSTYSLMKTIETATIAEPHLL
jgi:hypothetical protein